MKEKRFIDAWESPDIDIQWRQKIVNAAVEAGCLDDSYYIYDIEALDRVMFDYVDTYGFSEAYRMVADNIDRLSWDVGVAHNFFMVVEPVVGDTYVAFPSNEELCDITMEDYAEKGVIEFFKKENIPFDEILKHWY